MAGWSNNSACILDFLKLFQTLSAEHVNLSICATQWQELQNTELVTPDTILLAPRTLREHFTLDLWEYLLVMAALTIEMDNDLRTTFRSQYGLTFPTIEYGLKLISPLCPNRVEILADLNGLNTLTGLLLTTSQQTAYPLERPLILCRAVVSFLTGLSLPDLHSIQPLLPECSTVYLPIHTWALEQVQLWYQTGTEYPLYLLGAVGCGRRTLVKQACGGAVCLEFQGLTELSALDRDHLFREAAILSKLLSIPICAVYSHTSPATAIQALQTLCKKFHLPLVIVSDSEDSLSHSAEVIRLPSQLTSQERDQVWHTMLPTAAPDSIPNGSMHVGAVLETATLAQRYATANEHHNVQREDTIHALRHRSSALVYGLHYEPYASLNDMVLSESILKQIHQICTAAQCGPHLTHWGIPYEREGVTAVFHGPSGTGKTMAANAIARELGMPLLHADLSQIMDKYVGETEKHLGQLMRCARENRCVLLFDEADALFGKRTSVSTGHDKFANLSTSYLLQEIEQYDGVALLSTNLLNHFDDAFLRRLQYIVRFSMPDAKLREQLWRRALPSDRLEDNIPFAELAQAELSPARINGVARTAAIAAMCEGKKRINTAMILCALRLELEKNGKALPRELGALLIKPQQEEIQTTVKFI